MATVKEVIRDLHSSHNHYDVICALIWTIEDVMREAEEKGIKITKREAETILNQMEHDHDACCGISWQTIDSYLDDMQSEKNIINS